MEERSLLHNIRRTPKASTPVLVVSKLFTIAIPIAQFVMGVVYLNQCPLQRYIPIYLLVMGAFTVTLVVLSCLPCTQESEEGDQSPLSSLCTAWNSLVSLFLFCWFIAGNVWIYSIYPPNYDPDFSSEYCNRTLYLFAFWTTTLVYILLGVLLAGGCCVLICMCLCGRGGPGSGYSDDI